MDLELSISVPSAGVKVESLCYFFAQVSIRKGVGDIVPCPSGLTPWISLSTEISPSGNWLFPYWAHFKHHHLEEVEEVPSVGFSFKKNTQIPVSGCHWRKCLNSLSECFFGLRFVKGPLWFLYVARVTLLRTLSTALAGLDQGRTRVWLRAFFSCPQKLEPCKNFICCQMQKQEKALRILWDKKKGAQIRDVLKAQCSQHSLWERKDLHFFKIVSTLQLI